MSATALRKPPRQAQVTDAAQGGAGLRTFQRIADQWKLSVSDAMTLIGVDARSTYYELLRRARESGEVKGLSKDQLDRLSYLLGIYHSSRVLFPHSKETREQWVSRANTSSLFGGRPPLELMRSGMVGLYQTFAHLAAVRS